MNVYYGGSQPPVRDKKGTDPYNIGKIMFSV